MKTILLTILFISSISFAQAQPEEEKTPNAQAVDIACKHDAEIANCGNAKVGTGLLKCFRTYKQTKSEFKPSEGCKMAMRKFHKERKAALNDLVRE